MLSPDIMWPLTANTIRKNSTSNTFGMVRNGGKRAHQGWDLLAYPGTPIFAIADGEIYLPAASGDYGRIITLAFEFQGKTCFAAYCHLSAIAVKNGETVSAGDALGHTGNTGNAASMQGDDQHLHFEIRTIRTPGHGLGGRVDPKTVYGFVPLNTAVYDGRSSMNASQTKSAPGLKVPGLNVL